MIKTIEKPDSSKIREPKVTECLKNKDLMQLVQKSFYPYATWETVKHWPIPKEFRPEELWQAILFMRNVSRTPSVIQDETGNPFYWSKYLLSFEELLHHVDMKLGGNLLVLGDQNDEQTRHRLLSRGIMEEAIASSQLEGAHTTRKAAKKMLIEGRKPRTRHEQMIVNNYNAMCMIEDELKRKPLDEVTLLALHKALTTKTLDEDSEVGRYRRDDEKIEVGSQDGSETYHMAPPEAFVRKEIKRFLAYANDELKDVGFVHPVVKAIFLHFWIAYLHPFTDGNGRMARALFYWYLLRQEYWAFGYLPLSTVIKKSPTQYRDAFLFSEQDHNDLNYFLDYNIRKIAQSMDEFEKYVRRMGEENSKMVERARSLFGFNDRQIQLLQYFYKSRDATTSVTTYIKIYDVARMTAINDLKGLLKHGLVVSKKMGRIVYYYPTDKVVGLFE